MKYKDEWVLLTSINELPLDVSRDAISMSAYGQRRKGNDHSNWYRSVQGQTMVNIGFLKSIWERRRKIQLECQDCYYKITDKMKESDLTNLVAKYTGKSFQSIYEFYKKVLFADSYDIKLSNIKINRNLVGFHNFCTEYTTEITFDSIDEEFDYYEAKRIKENYDRTTDTEKDN